MIRGIFIRPSQTAKMEVFAKIVNDWELLAVFAKSFILDAWQGSEYTSDEFPQVNKFTFISRDGNRMLFLFMLKSAIVKQKVQCGQDYILIGQSVCRYFVH